MNRERKYWHQMRAGVVAVCFAALACFTATVVTAAPARPLTWAEMMPPMPPAPAKQRKGMFDVMKQKLQLSDGRNVMAEAEAQVLTSPQAPDAKFMSQKRYQPGSGKPPAIVAALDGQRVALGGYLVPLDFSATKITEFLLVPFVGACIHVPPPPANQIVYVKAAAGFEASDLFAPITVTGIIRTSFADTGLAEAGYTMDAESVDLIQP
jgi:uncharacterized protein